MSTNGILDDVKIWKDVQNKKVETIQRVIEKHVQVYMSRITGETRTGLMIKLMTIFEVNWPYKKKENINVSLLIFQAYKNRNVIKVLGLSSKKEELLELLMCKGSVA